MQTEAQLGNGLEAVAAMEIFFFVVGRNVRETNFTSTLEMTFLQVTNRVVVRRSRVT